jgi:long-chain fatty acid transport protein
VSNYGAILWFTGEPEMVKKYTISTLLAALFLVLSAHETAANGFSLPDQDAFATARGEAFVATADNASAVYYNPAGISQLSGVNIRGGLNSIYYEPTYQPPNSGHTYYSQDNFAYLPQIFLTYSAKDAPLSCGVGVYAPFGGNMSWPQNTGFRTVAISGSLKYVTINPVVAVKLTPTLSIGGGVMFNYAKINMYQGLTTFPFPPGNQFYDYFNFTGNGWSYGYNVGILWQPLAKLSFGATFRSSSNLKFDGNTQFQLPFENIIQQQRDALVNFNFPLTTVFGVSYRPTPKWNLEFDANYTDWNSFGNLTIQQSPPPVKDPPFTQNIPVHLDWEGSWMYEFGATRYFDNGWHVSGGYVFNENSVPNTYYTPLAADLNRNFFSLGAGFKGKRFDFDIAYQLGFAFKHDVSGSQSSTKPASISGGSADGAYGFSSSAIIATVGIHF